MGHGHGHGHGHNHDQEEESKCTEIGAGADYAELEDHHHSHHHSASCSVAHNTVLVISGILHAITIVLLTRNPFYSSSFSTESVNTTNATTLRSGITTSDSLATVGVGSDIANFSSIWNSPYNPVYLPMLGSNWNPTTVGLLVLLMVAAKNMGTIYNNRQYQEECVEFFTELARVVRGQARAENPCRWLYLILLFLVLAVAVFSAYLVADEVYEVYFEELFDFNNIVRGLLKALLVLINLLTCSYIVVADTLGLVMHKIFGHDSDHEHAPPFFLSKALSQLCEEDLSQLQLIVAQYKKDDNNSALASAVGKVISLREHSVDFKTVRFADAETKALRDYIKKTSLSIAFKLFNWLKIAFFVILTLGSMGEFFAAYIRVNNGGWDSRELTIATGIIWVFSPGVMFEFIDLFTRVIMGLDAKSRCCPERKAMLLFHIPLVLVLLGNHFIMLGAEGIVSSEQISVKEVASMGNDAVESTLEVIYHWLGIVTLLNIFSQPCCPSREKRKSMRRITDSFNGDRRGRGSLTVSSGSIIKTDAWKDSAASGRGPAKSLTEVVVARPVSGGRQ